MPSAATATPTVLFDGARFEVTVPGAAALAAAISAKMRGDVDVPSLKQCVQTVAFSQSHLKHDGGGRFDWHISKTSGKAGPMRKKSQVSTTCSIFGTTGKDGCLVIQAVGRHNRKSTASYTMGLVLDGCEKQHPPSPKPRGKRTLKHGY